MAPADLSLDDLKRVLKATQKGGSKQELMLKDIKAGLPIKVQCELTTALVPLSKGEKTHPQQDLSHFWKRCERALNGLSSDFGVEDLQAPHLWQLYPFVLDQPVWVLLKKFVLDSWQEVKAAVEERLGLTTDQLLDCFYGMRQGKTESASEFML